MTSETVMKLPEGKTHEGKAAARCSIVPPILVTLLLVSPVVASGRTHSLFPACEDSRPPLSLVLPEEEHADSTTGGTSQGIPAAAVPEKSPPWAAVRSLLVPGWGQIYTDHRLKAVLVAGAEASLFVLWRVEENASDSDYEKYLATGNEAFLDESDRHDGRASNYLTWTIIATFLSVLDAYVDAKFYGFDEKLKLEEGDEGVRVSLRFH